MVNGQFEETVIRAGDVAQVIEYQLSKCKALNSNPCTTKKIFKETLTIIINVTIICYLYNYAVNMSFLSFS
jgi:hypothetical protein